MGRVSVAEIKPGMTLAEDIRHSNGRFLLGKGVVLDRNHLRILKIWGIHSVEVENDPDDSETLSDADMDPAAVRAAQKWVAARFLDGSMDHPFCRELHRICTLRKAREIARSRGSGQGAPSSASLQEPLVPETSDLPISPLDRRVAPETLMSEDMGLASLPNIFWEISKVINDPRSSAVLVADVISKDTSLSAKLLKIVNSAFYGFPSKIDTISRAVTIVGTRQLSTLALGASVIRIFQDIPASLVDMESFWRHSITCGVTARLIASYRRISNAERIFVAGLLHDIGRIILFLRMPSLERDILLRAGRRHKSSRAIEVEVLGYDHGLVGGLLLKKWKLPIVLEHEVAYHHDPLQSQYPAETSIICLSDLLTNALEMGSSGERLIPPLAPVIWEEAGVKTETLPELVGLVERQVSEISRHFFDEG